MRCLAARVHYKTLIVICALLSLLTVVLWNKCTSEKALRFLPQHPQPPPSPKIDSHPQQPQPPEPPPVVGGVRYEEIDCLINDDATIKGRREGSEVYLPFSWMEKYFEVYGKVVQYDGYDRFEFSHSYSKYTPRESCTTPAESSCPLRGITWRCVTESSASVEWKVSYVVMVTPSLIMAA